MDVVYEHGNTTFRWDQDKADQNARKHGHSMLSKRLKERLRQDRPNTTITLRIPVDVVETLKAIAPSKGYSGYQTLLKSYISDGLRRDEAQMDSQTTQRLAEALKRRGISDRTLRDAIAEARSHYTVDSRSKK